MGESGRRAHRFAGRRRGADSGDLRGNPEIQKAKTVYRFDGRHGDVWGLLHRRRLRQDRRQPWDINRIHRRDHATEQPRRLDEENRRQGDQRQKRREQRHRLAVSTVIPGGKTDSSVVGR